MDPHAAHVTGQDLGAQTPARSEKGDAETPSRRLASDPRFHGTKALLAACSGMQEGQLSQVAHDLAGIDSKGKAALIFDMLTTLDRDTLQTISSYLVPALKLDILSELPPEVAYRIFSYLDSASLRRCIRVSQQWNKLILNEDSQKVGWKNRVVMQNWFNLTEVNELIKAYNTSQGIDVNAVISSKRKHRSPMNKLQIGGNNNMKSYDADELNGVVSHLKNFSNDQSSGLLSPRSAVDFDGALTSNNGNNENHSNGGLSSRSFNNRPKRARSQDANAALDLTSSTDMDVDGTTSSRDHIINNQIENGIYNDGSDDEDYDDDADHEGEFGGGSFTPASSTSSSLTSNAQLAGVPYIKNSGKNVKIDQYLFEKLGKAILDVDQNLKNIQWNDGQPLVQGSWSEHLIKELRRNKREMFNVTLTDEYPQLSLPPNLYSNLYQQHNKIRRNWFLGRNKHITFPGHQLHVVTCLQFDNDKIVSGSDDKTINIYDTNTCELRHTLEGHTGGVWALQYWQNVLVSGSTDRTIRIWNMDTAECRHVFYGHTSTVRCLALIVPKMNVKTGIIEPREPLIVTGSRDHTLRVWKLPHPTEDAPYNPNPDDMQPRSHSDVANDNPYFKFVLSGHEASVRALAGEGNIVVSGSYDTKVRVWDIEKGEAKYTFSGHSDKVYSVGYSHELDRAVSGSMDNTVKVWCLKTGTLLFDLVGHTSLVGLLELTPKYLISAAADSTLKIWSPVTGECLATLTGHSAAITCFHHIPELNRIVSGADGGIKVWELSSADYGEDDPSISSNQRVIVKEIASYDFPRVRGNTAAGTSLTTTNYTNQHTAVREVTMDTEDMVVVPTAGSTTNLRNAFSTEPMVSVEEDVQEIHEMLNGNSRVVNGKEVVHGRFIRNLVTGVQGVWRVRMDEKRLVCAVQRPDGHTCFELLDFSSNEPGTVVLSPPPPQTATSTEEIATESEHQMQGTEQIEAGANLNRALQPEVTRTSEPEANSTRTRRRAVEGNSTNEQAPRRPLPRRV